MAGLIVSLGFVILVLGALTASLLAAIRWTLSPLLNSDGRHVGQDHFTLTDVACLTVQVAAALTIVKSVVPEVSELRNSASVLALATAFVLWWGAVRVLSRAMVGHPVKRVAFMLLIAPFSISMAMTIVAAPFVGIANFLQNRGGIDAVSTWVMLGYVVVTMTLASLISVGLNRATRWVVRQDSYSARVGGPTPIQFQSSGLKSRKGAPHETETLN